MKCCWKKQIEFESKKHWLETEEKKCVGLKNNYTIKGCLPIKWKEINA